MSRNHGQTMPRPPVHMEAQPNTIEGDVAVGIARDPSGRKVHVIKISTQRMESVIVLTTPERDNLVRALTMPDPEENPEAAARASIWTPPSEQG